MLSHRTSLRRAAAPGAAPAPVPLPSPRGTGSNAADLLTPAAVAELLGVKPKVLERWRGAGEGPRFVRLHRRCLIRCSGRSSPPRRGAASLV
jgi:hypothetical protein